MSAARASLRRRRLLAALWTAGAGVGIGCLVLVALPRDPSVPVVRQGKWWRPAAGRYAGTEACRACHADLVERQQASAHARTLRRLGPKAPPVAPVTGQAVTDPLTGARYRVVADRGTHWVEIESGPLRARARLEWEFGSGTHAHGYLGRLDDGTVFDCRLNWYRKPAKWDFASGQDKPTRSLLQNPLGRPLPPGEVARCFSCHATQIFATGATPEGAAGDALRLDPARTVAGVTCEGCHGPRADHVEAFRSGRKPPPRPPMTATEINRLCGECHSLPDLRSDHEVIARFQPWGLERSRCFIRSEGRLSCLTCHDPHDNARHDAAYYDGICLTCHRQPPAAGRPRGGVCPVSASSGCTSCHMPRDSRSMLHMTFTDHRIRIERRSGGNSARAGSVFLR